MQVPAELKYITPYVQRGQELTERDPVIAYYGRDEAFEACIKRQLAQYYAAQLAITKGPSTTETNAYISHLLDSLEQQKKGMDRETITNDLVGYAHVENFALKVFLSADNEDRAGKANKRTAKTFLAASIFLEILKGFQELDVETEAKIKYAKWKATDITKALREGRQPQIGSPSDQQDNLPPISEFPSPPTNFGTPPAPEPIITPEPIIPPEPTIPSEPSTPEPIIPFVASIPKAPLPVINTNMPSAQKHAKWAISAMEYEDIKTARTELLNALKDIGFTRENNFGF